MMPTFPSRACLLLLAALLATGCAVLREPGDRALAGRAFDDEGRRLFPATVHRILAGADVVILGETHDDAKAHALQLALFRAASRAAGSGHALSLEMMERDEQPHVDAWLEGEITTGELVERTGSADWAGKGSWAAWYQPILDAARESGAGIVAANAPRRIVRMAWQDGREAMEALPPEERALFDFPVAEHPGYQERFLEAMASHMGDEDEKVQAMFLSQLVTDATMAESIVRAHDAGARPVVHLVGQFHSDFEGGLVGELRARRPGLKVVVVSLSPTKAARSLAAEDEGRADVVIHTR
jgi:uncharacterized iron-regulated protein